MGSMMSPLVAVDEDRELVAVAGAAGGSRIRPALVQVLMRMLRGADPQDAIDAPRLNALPGLVRPNRFHSGGALRPGGGLGGGIAEHRDPYFGGVSALSALGGGADPRRSGFVALV